MGPQSVSVTGKDAAGSWFWSTIFHAFVPKIKTLGLSDEQVRAPASRLASAKNLFISGKIVMLSCSLKNRKLRDDTMKNGENIQLRPSAISLYIQPSESLEILHQAL